MGRSTDAATPIPPHRNGVATPGQGSRTADEWRFPNRATPLGSSAYYSVRIAPKDLRDDLAAILGWRHQVRAILNEVSDPGVARLKLQWWRDELERTVAGEPRHPLSRALRPATERHLLPQPLFHGIADQVESQVRCRYPAGEADLDAACEQDMGALFELIVRCHGLSDSEPLLTARRLGTFCARVYLIRDSGALARRDRTPLPTEDLHARGLSTSTLVRREHRDVLQRLLAASATRARAKLVTAEHRREMPDCIRARTRILESLLDEIEGMDFDVADQRVGLTPLRKLWLTWRESRRR